MHLSDVQLTWNSFFHTPQSPGPVAVFRIVWGALLFMNGLILVKDAAAFFGPEGYFPTKRHQAVFGRSRFTLCLLLPEGVQSVYLILAAHLVSAICLCVGFYTRTSAAIAFLTMLSLHHRNPSVFHSGDTVMRLLTFLLMFSQAGSAYSLDQWLLEHKLGSSSEFSPWCVRLMQIQVSFVYLRAVYWKMTGKLWWAGTAAYYPTQLEGFRRAELPASLRSMFWIRLATWGTLAVQLSLSTLVWFEETRYLALLLGVGLHLSFELFLNLQLFSWTMIASYVVFIRPQDLTSFLSLLRLTWFG